MRSIVLLIFLLFSSIAVFPQAEKKRVSAVAVNESIRIDGVLDEPAWQSVPVATEFIQRMPYNGKPATFATEVRFIYDNSGLYIGAMMYDTNPDSIPAQMGLRDSEGLNADNFVLLISPFNDGLNAFCFQVYVSDIQTDFKLSGADADDDYSWDAIWVSKARINDRGWVAEMKIPYSAVRFPKKEVQEWGINCQREIRRYRELDTWNFIDQKVSGIVNQCGVLDELRNLSPPLRLSVSPYVAGYLQNRPEDPDYNFSGSYGADLKYGINESFTLDMTLIPDFGQVRSDDKVYNFSPFEIRYNERRQFFTEGTELFNKGGIFYTRRVGDVPKGYDNPYIELNVNEVVKENPDQTKLINASKISGRTSGGLGIGFFNGMSANTWATVEDTATLTSRSVLTQGFTNYNTIVLDQNLKNNSYLDFLNTNYYMPTEGYTANVTGTSFKFANNSYTYALVGDGFISQKYYSHKSPELGYHYSLSYAKIAGNFRFDLSQLLETDTYDPNDMGFNIINNRFENSLTTEYNFYTPFWRVLNWYNEAGVSYNTLYEDFKFTYCEFYAASNTTTLKHLSIGANTNFSPFDANDYYEPRAEGWMYVSPAYGNLSNWISTDYRKKLAIDISLSGFLSPQYKTSGYSLSIRPRYRITDRIFMIYRFYYEKIRNDVGYVDQSTDSTGSQIIWFGRRDRQTVTNVVEANYMITSAMSIDLRVRHYWVSAPYFAYFILQRDGSLAPAGYPFDSDVNYNLFNLDLTYIWNFAPGSQISVMWKKAITTLSNEIEPKFLTDVRNTLTSPSSNSFSIKILYYFDSAYLKKRRN